MAEPQELVVAESGGVQVTKPKKAKQLARSNRAAGEWKEPFLASLRRSPNILLAAKAAGISRQLAYDTRAKDPAFAKAWDEAREEAIDLIELRAEKLIDQLNPTMIIFLLKSLRPQVYNPSVKLEHSGGEKPIEYQVKVIPDRQVLPSRDADDTDP